MSRGRQQNCSQSQAARSFPGALPVIKHPHRFAHCHHSSLPLSITRIRITSNLYYHHNNPSHHPSCLASPAVPPLRPSAPPFLLLALHPRLSRLARPAPSPSLLLNSTLLLLLLPPLLRLQQAVVAVSSARWPAPLRKLPREASATNPRA